MASVLVAAYFLPLILFCIWSAKFQSQFTANQQPTKVSLRESSLGSDKVKLVDVVLLASIDGRFHALNRTTGRMIWSMDHPKVEITNLKELVSTEHRNLSKTNYVSLDDLIDDPASTETYIIEPQSGTIFVSPPDSTRGDPLQILPFTMQQLVEMSPFRMDHRTFVGKKRTSLVITLDLASGEVVEVLNPEQQCSRGDQPTRKSTFQSRDGELLEEPDSPRADRALVHIRRTEYHISVFLHDQVVQNLTYASYDPNSTDKEVQDDWRNTPDSLYHLPTPDGKLLMFKTDETEPFHSFIDRLKRPIVAVFDAIYIAKRSDPLLLAQPKPALSDLYPSRSKEIRELLKQNDITWVGRIGNSLYALSYHTFSLVIFSQMATHDVEIPLQTVCTTLDCLIGPHRTEKATPGRSTRSSGAS